ncbi:MAG: DUF4115 domain-containing protein [Gammaproteobacteria bacterium]|nr:DUF4115 domain-containing protein [Gammaproteobacteria bacterium]
MSATDDARDAQKLTPGNEPGRDLAAGGGARDVRADGFGPALRAAREKAGLSVVEIANALKVTERTVNALEAERYEDLPPRPYVRGYVRRYARLVGLDATTVAVGSDTVEAESVLPAVVPRSRWALFDDFARESWGLVYGSIVLVFVILIGGALWWAWQGGNVEQAVPAAVPNTARADPPPTAAASPPTPEVAPEAVATEQGDPVPKLESAPDGQGEPAPALESTPAVQGEPAPALASTAAVPESSEPGGTVPAPAEAAAVEPGVVDADTDEPATDDDALAGPDRITFVFEGDCWVEVRALDGDLLHGDLGRDGETATVRGRAPFSVLLGNPAVVDVTFNGERVSVDPVRPGQVARFEVGG